MTNARPILMIAAALLLTIAWVGVRSSPIVGRPGGRQRIAGAQNDLQLQNLAKFAVNQYNAKQNASLVYVRLVSVEQQVVAGTMYYLVLEAAGQGGVSKLYEAKVWVKPWKNFKSLQGFKEKSISGAQPHVETINPDGMFATNNGDLSMQPVEFDDPVVKEAAKQALKTLQERFNSLTPYELKKVISTRAQLHKESTSYNLMLTAQRGSKEEQIDAVVVRTSNGAWIVRDVHLHH